MGGNLRLALAPTLHLQYPRECNMCSTSLRGGVGGTRAQGLKIKHSNRIRSDLWRCSPNLEVILLGFASHDDVESVIRVLGAALNAAGHVLLILVRVEPHAERSGVSSQLRLWFRSWIRMT